MKAAPVSIFVWGVDPDISIDDIREDLAASDINVSQDDIEKKTRTSEIQHEGRRPLDCYKITLKAEDLDAAMAPDVWPARVRVRQWINYPSKRPPAKDDSNGRQPTRDSRPTLRRGPPPSPAVDALLDPAILIAKNQFSLLSVPTPTNSSAPAPATAVAAQ